MSHVFIGGNYYNHIADYLFAPTYSYPYYGQSNTGPWYGYGSYGYPYYC